MLQSKAPVSHLFLLSRWESILPPCGTPTGEVSEGWWLAVPDWLEHTADLSSGAQPGQLCNLTLALEGMSPTSLKG